MKRLMRSKLKKIMDGNKPSAPEGWSDPGANPPKGDKTESTVRLLHQKWVQVIKMKLQIKHLNLRVNNLCLLIFDMVFSCR